uniref:Uncharacterized protein n=1 Tax=Pipistrellus kuhlii TaxID=59472 RepID=A0A7J7UG76_PIPKU|nr:hypothetical protein mPipKuh1_009091 [Pipistrellus kuhlii]
MGTNISNLTPATIPRPSHPPPFPLAPGTFGASPGHRGLLLKHAQPTVWRKGQSDRGDCVYRALFRTPGNHCRQCLWAPATWAPTGGCGGSSGASFCPLTWAPARTEDSSPGLGLLPKPPSEAQREAC